MSTIAKELADILNTVRRPGDYFTSGRAEFLAPRLEVDGVGPVALPLLPVQAEQLIAAAERAPYGRGPETVVDTTVRRTWQIGADRVRIGGKHWTRTLDGIVARAAEGLGVSEPVSAELYKLLIYDPGSFFVSHRDTEKTPGMFATLVLALPAHSEGGELVVRHKGRDARIDLRCEEPSEIAFAAFYADCVHEVLPVTSGCRAVLVYNLVRQGKGAAPEPPSYTRELTAAATLLRGWAESKSAAADGAPKKLIHLLEHAYTPAELDFGKLKGADAAIAGVLTSAAPEAGCDLHLALLSIEESGIAEYTGYYGSRYRRGWEEPEFEAGEVVDRDESLSEWRRPDGAQSTLGRLPMEEDEISPPDALADMEPDEEEFHEATGNEGASFERTYSRAALVLWPSTGTLAVLNQAGLSATLPYLGELTEKWRAQGADASSPVRRQALALAGHMLSTWPKWEWYPRHESGPSETARMLALLARLGAKEHTETLIAIVIARRGHDKSDNAAILDALGLLSPDRAADLLARIVASNAYAALGACSNLLAGAVKGRFADKPRRLLATVEALVEALPGGPPPDPKEHQIRLRPSEVDSSVIVDLVPVVDAVDDGLAKRAASHVLAWPKPYRPDKVLVPAIRRLKEAGTREGQAFERLRAACLAHLEGRAAAPLEAPKDWTRASGIGCTCTHCAALGRFLADGERETWSLKAVQHIRTHVEETIRSARCDVDFRTERRGSPHTLICAKNRASHERRAAQRKRDLADIAALKG